MTYRNRRLLNLAHDAPCCLRLGLCSGQIVPCHSDQLADGRGIGHKSHDCLAVPGCVACHSKFTRKHLGAAEYNIIQGLALKRYLVWMWENGKVGVL